MPGMRSKKEGILQGGLKKVAVMKKYILLMVLVCCMFVGCDSDSGDDDNSIKADASDSTVQIPVYSPTILNTYPHKTDAFTEGLVYENGYLYESTGMESQSSLRKVDIATGETVKRYDLAPEYFGEGIALYNDKIMQLTWKNGKAFVYNKDSFDTGPVDSFTYPEKGWNIAEGWGMTYDGTNIIMSDGTNVLYYLNPIDYSVVKQVNVTANGEPVTYLNELEYINGKIYANVWQTRKIAIIQTNGQVVGWINLEGILSSGDCSNSMDVLNGIAYNPAENTIYVTGKYWCKLFEIDVVP
jgi:glutaminyl-peptide cyclotransferase